MGMGTRTATERTGRRLPRRRYRACLTCGHEERYVRARGNRPPRWRAAAYGDALVTRLWLFARLPDALKRAGLSVAEFSRRFDVRAHWDRGGPRGDGSTRGIWFRILPGEETEEGDRSLDPRVGRIAAWAQGVLGAQVTYGYHDAVNGHPAPIHRCRHVERWTRHWDPAGVRAAVAPCPDCPPRPAQIAAQ